MDINSKSGKEKVEAVKQMQDYIQTHLREPITQLQLSSAAGYSEYYAAKIFRELTGRTPFEYIRLFRLSEASKKLCDADARVIDVAFDYVFDSHEGFTRAFAKEFGITPKKYSKHPKTLNLFAPINIRDFYLYRNKRNEENDMNKTPGAIFVQILDRPERKVILKRGKSADDYYQYCIEMGCEEAEKLWETLCGIKEALYEPIGMWLPEKFRPEGTSLYVQGVEVPVDYSGNIPEGCEVIELPACKMLVFQGPPYDDEKYCEAINELWEQTANYNPEIYGYEWADGIAPKFQLAPMGYRGYIEGRPVREINKK